MDDLVDDVHLTPEQESLLTGYDYFGVADEAPFILWNGNTTAMHNGELCFSPYIEIWHDGDDGDDGDELDKSVALYLRGKIEEIAIRQFGGFVECRKAFDLEDASGDSLVVVVFCSIPFSSLSKQCKTSDDTKSLVIEMFEPIKEFLISLAEKQPDGHTYITGQGIKDQLESSSSIGRECELTKTFDLSR